MYRKQVHASTTAVQFGWCTAWAIHTFSPCFFFFFFVFLRLVSMTFTRLCRLLQTSFHVRKKNNNSGNVCPARYRPSHGQTIFCLFCFSAIWNLEIEIHFEYILLCYWMGQTGRACVSQESLIVFDLVWIEAFLNRICLQCSITHDWCPV